MKKILSIIALSGLLGSTDVLAIAGGPFDNGDAGGLLLERAGFYQCTFRFNNGTGYGVFTPDAQLSGGFIGAVGGGGGGGGQQAAYSAGNMFTNNSFDLNRNANRSVFYYKGVTYVGGCFGMPDLEARVITGTANATSDPPAFIAQTATNSTGGLFAGGGNTTNQTITVINNTSYIVNAGWEAKITRLRPTLRFKGKGQLAVVSPTGNSSVTNLAFEAYRGLLGSINQSVSGLQNATGAPVNFGSAQQAIRDVLVDLRDQVTGLNGAEDTFKESLTEELKVDGTRRFY